CYGIGVSRVLAATIEQNHDEKGIIFPWQIAPFQIGIIPLKDSFKEKAESLYQGLSQKWDVLLDDRDERPGVKFNDLDLIGVPLQIILGKAFEEKGEVEIKQRKTGERVYLKLEEVENYVQGFAKKGA
ncbi:MAG TPA: proline--tRNA ligase, partial [Thermodesulfobacterium commune]|nr:proline--tRNA ligase [Thermodesulfobacterium commune]